jgi:hypothetical protein
MPVRSNDRWSMNFVADTFRASRRLRILAIDDDACYEDLCLLGNARQRSATLGNARQRSATLGNARQRLAQAGCLALRPQQRRAALVAGKPNTGTSAPDVPETWRLRIRPA